MIESPVAGLQLAGCRIQKNKYDAEHDDRFRHGWVRPGFCHKIKCVQTTEIVDAADLSEALRVPAFPVSSGRIG